MNSSPSAGYVQPAQAVAPFAVHSVHFDFPGGGAVRLKDPATDQFIGRAAEWVAGGSIELVAYVRASVPWMRVVFRGAPAANGTYAIGADGTLFPVEEKTVTLAFDPVTGLSAAEAFQARAALPDRIGVHLATLAWYVRTPAAAAQAQPVGASSHRIATSWRRFPAPPTGEAGLSAWAYAPLMDWTCQWAAGLGDEKAICDAIIANVAYSGLRYGVPLVRTVAELLVRQGGMCGVWYQAFQHMAHCQGVFVHRRRFLVDRRPMARNEEHWCAIVIRAGGLNRAAPNVPPMPFRDNRTVFPIPVGGVPIVTVSEPRWRFWSAPPGFVADGHCINFLVYDRELYLYDACFGVGPIKVDAPLPANNVLASMGGADLAPFRTAYLDAAIDYMLGSIWTGLISFRPTSPT